jgi:hypothetical protein
VATPSVVGTYERTTISERTRWGSTLDAKGSPQIDARIRFAGERATPSSSFDLIRLHWDPIKLIVSSATTHCQSCVLMNLYVVRRDEAVEEPRGEAPGSRCTSPAGASPARAGAGAPGSRPQAEGEIPPARAGRRKPLRREQERGPQHEVKPAASTDEQWGSRAEHVTAKATPDALRSGGACAPGPSGVWGAARVQGEVRNTRGPSASPSSRQGGSHKPKVKAGAAQRESEGIVVPSIAVKNNAAGGKGPCFGQVGGGGKREGMAGKTGPNHPDGRKSVVLGGRRPDDKVRQLQRRLWSAAKGQPGRRFHALYDRIVRGDVLAEAWKRVRRNRGAAGVDAQTLAAIEQRGVELFLEELGAELRAGRYRPAAVLRRYIPTPPARDRPVPGGRVTWRSERPPVSRVREIRTHGLKGGPTLSLRPRCQGKGRVYQ